MKCKKCGTVLKEVNYEKGLCDECQEHHLPQIELSGKIVLILGLLLIFGSIALFNWMISLKIGMLISCMVFVPVLCISFLIFLFGIGKISAGY